MTALITCFNDLNLVAQPMSIIILLSAFIGILFGLFKYLNESLCKVDIHWNRSIKLDYLNILTRNKKFAFYVGILVMITVSLTLIRWGYPKIKDGQTDTFCQVTNFVIPLLIVCILIWFCYLTIIAANGVYKSNEQRIKRSLDGIEATICFKNGRRLTGGLQNLNILKGYPYFKMYLREGKDVWIDSTKIAAIFLIRGDSYDATLQDKMFTDGPRSLVLKLGTGEKFEYAKYFDRSGFRVFRCYKKDTNTHTVIAPRKMVIHQIMS